MREEIAHGVRAAARPNDHEVKRAEADRLRAHRTRWVKVERDGEAAQALQKFLSKHGGELGWWAELGGAAHSNLAEQGLRPRIA